MHTKAPILVAMRGILDLLRGVMTHSLHDVDVNVRRSTAAVLHELAELVFDPWSVPWLVLISFFLLSHD